jgi:DNA-binding LacI/PurR family transcriptional regulator
MAVYQSQEARPVRWPRAVASRGAILQALKAEIVGGGIPPGGRLPTRAKLRRRFDTTPVTIQRAFDELSQEGFIVARGRRGTFVNPRPPHLTNYALVFPYRDTPEHPWSNFWRALVHEAGIASRRNGHRLFFSYGNETHQDLEDYAKLQADVRAHRLAGLIFASPPGYLKGSPVLETPGVPRVAIMRAPGMKGVAAVHLSPRLTAMALDRLEACGRRRVAVVARPEQVAGAQAVLAERGLETPPYWVHAINPLTPEGARNIVHLLMSGSPRCRPDGLVILDDNLTPHATAGVADAGVRVPRDLLAISHCNFPHPTPNAVPVVRLGYDVREVLRAGLELLEAQRRGKNAPGEAEAPVVEEQDVSMAGQ